MRASPQCVHILLFSTLITAHPAKPIARRDADGKQMWEEIIELEKVIIQSGATSTLSTWYTTVTVDTYPTGYPGSDVSQKVLHDNGSEENQEAPAESVPTSSNYPRPTDAGDADGNAKAVEKFAVAPTSSTASPASTTPPSSAVAGIAITSSTPPTTSELNKTEDNQTAANGNQPFKAMVVFGDNLSDNGNGSYAYKVTGDPGVSNKVYGYGTWTDHAVTPSYLTDLLGVPMTQNFAFGHAWGGSSAGATVDDTLWQSNFSKTEAQGPYFPTEFSEPCWGAPSTKVQIEDYIKSGVDKEALHFLWIGNNDVNMATFYQGQSFVDGYSSKVVDQVNTLLTAGAPQVFVVNIYAKHLAPVVPAYYPGWTSQQSWDDFGKFIDQANSALEAKLAGLDAQKVLYYDVFSFMTTLWNDATNGFSNQKDSNGWPAFCDGDPNTTPDVAAAIKAGTVTDAKNQNNWGVCVEEQKWEEWYWMQYLDMTSGTNKLIAKDMSEKISAHFAQ